MSPRKIARLAPDHSATLYWKIENEGDLLYTVENWEFKDFHDKKFNSLRKALVEAARKFRDYTHCEEEPEVNEEPEEESCSVCGDTLDTYGACRTCGAVEYS